MSAESVLAEALSSIVASIELADDSAIDPDVATSLTEPVAALLQRASPEDRETINGLIIHAAELELNPIRKEMILSIPEGFGIVD